MLQLTLFDRLLFTQDRIVLAVLGVDGCCLISFRIRVPTFVSSQLNLVIFVVDVEDVVLVSLGVRAATMRRSFTNAFVDSLNAALHHEIVREHLEILREVGVPRQAFENSHRLEGVVTLDFVTSAQRHSLERLALQVDQVVSLRA